MIDNYLILIDIILIWLYCLLSIFNVKNKYLLAILRILIGVLFGYAVFLELTRYVNSSHYVGFVDFSLKHIINATIYELISMFLYIIPIIIISLYITNKRKINKDEMKGNYYSNTTAIILFIIALLLFVFVIGGTSGIIEYVVIISLCISIIIMIYNSIISDKKNKKTKKM